MISLLGLLKIPDKIVDRFTKLTFCRSTITEELQRLKQAGMPVRFISGLRDIYVKSPQYEWPKITEGYLLLVQTENVTDENMAILSKCVGKQLEHPFEWEGSINFVARDLARCKKTGKTPQEVYKKFLTLCLLDPETKA